MAQQRMTREERIARAERQAEYCRRYTERFYVPVANPRKRKLVHVADLDLGAMATTIRAARAMRTARQRAADEARAEARRLG